MLGSAATSSPATGAKTGRTAQVGPMRDTPPYRAIPFRDSIAEGGIARVLPCFHRVSRNYR